MPISEDRLATLAALGGDISDLVAEVKLLRTRAVEPTPPAQSPIRLGNTVFIRTVTNCYVGRITLVDDEEIVLDNAAWVADTGRFHVALRDGVLNEIEPYVGPVSVSRGSLVDCCDWRHVLPKAAK